MDEDLKKNKKIFGHIAFYIYIVYNNSTVKLAIRASSHAFGVKASTEM